MYINQLHDYKYMKERLGTLVWQHLGILKVIGCVKRFKHRIDLVPGTNPVAVPIFRRSPTEKFLEKDMVESFIAQGIMNHCESSWEAANVFVPKKDVVNMRCTTAFRFWNIHTTT